MANEIQLPWYSATGANLYGVLVNWDPDSADYGKVWRADTHVWEAMTVASWPAGYPVPLTESPGGSHRYVADTPAGLTRGFYYLMLFLRAGGAPALTDTQISATPVYFDGTKWRAANKTEEQLLAVLAGKQTYDPATGIVTNYHRDNTTPAVVKTLTGAGNRGNPTLG